MTSFKSLGLTETVVQGVLTAGYDTPTPIQKTAIPIAQDGQDLIGCAQTGTGKTAAFVLPMLDRLLRHQNKNKHREVRALVVVPTRELALQVEEAVRIYGRHTRLRSLHVFGGVGIHPQIQKLRRGVDILVATPGRLLDLLNRGSVSLSRVEMLILDEADRMLDMGFIHDIRKIVEKVPAHRQTLLFSATMPDGVRSLARSIQHKPEYIEIGRRRNPAKSVEQRVCETNRSEKTRLLVHILKNQPIESVIVFSRTKHRADRIARQLFRKGFSTTALHSNRSQSQRQRSLKGFKNGHFQILVATDIAARGIDIDRVSHVINYDTPRQPEDYIHRIGRTGRADATGDAITFVDEEELNLLYAIERHIGKSLDRMEFEGLTVRHPKAKGKTLKRQSNRSSNKFRKNKSWKAKARKGTARRRKGNTSSKSKSRKFA